MLKKCNVLTHDSINNKIYEIYEAKKVDVKFTTNDLWDGLQVYTPLSRTCSP